MFSAAHIGLAAKDLVETDGFAVLERFVEGGVVDWLLAAMGADGPGLRAGTRQCHQRVPAIAEFLGGETVRDWVDALLPGGFPVRTILFDKTLETNWRVPWHQDLSIAVRDMRPVAGFGPWSVKEGVAHVQPPTPLLERMLTVRLHLDDCGPANGPLRVIPRSHLGGKLSAEGIAEWRRKGEVVDCVAPRGGAVVMRPLLLHSSSVATRPSHRRVLHVEFAAEALPPPLEWTR